MSISIPTSAQDFWVSYSNKINTKDFAGLKFRLSAFIKTSIIDDSASARIWARVDNETGVKFFDNMDNRPVRNKDWSTYSIEGAIDSSSYQLAFGTLALYNGTFYYDDLKLEIETQKGVWRTVFNNDFENGAINLEQGIQRWGRGINNLYSAEIWKSAAAHGRNCLKIEGENVPNYGNNNRVGKFANVNGIKLYYEIYGEGQPLLVLHGNGGSIMNAATHYPDLIKKYKVIAIDSRGQGKSTDTDEPLTYDKMASDINELLEQLKIDSVLIWGYSDGAILGIILGKDYPKKVKKVLAFGPNIQPDSSAVFPWAINYTNKSISKSKDPKDKRLNELMRDYPNIPFTELSKIKAPVLIMGGDRDVIRPEHLLKIFQNIPNSQLCILPGATHGASWQKKDLFMKILADFFDKPFSMPTTEDWYKE